MKRKIRILIFGISVVLILLWVVKLFRDINQDTKFLVYKEEFILLHVNLDVLSQIAEIGDIPKDKIKELVRYEIEARIHLGEAETYLNREFFDDYEKSANLASDCIEKMETIINEFQKSSGE